MVEKKLIQDGLLKWIEETTKLGMVKYYASMDTDGTKKALI